METCWCTRGGAVCLCQVLQLLRDCRQGLGQPGMLRLPPFPRLELPEQGPLWWPCNLLLPDDISEAEDEEGMALQILLGVSMGDINPAACAGCKPAAQQQVTVLPTACLAPSPANEHAHRCQLHFRT